MVAKAFFLSTVTMRSMGGSTARVRPLTKMNMLLFKVTISAAISTLIIEALAFRKMVYLIMRYSRTACPCRNSPGRGIPLTGDADRRRILPSCITAGIDSCSLYILVYIHHSIR